MKLPKPSRISINQSNSISSFNQSVSCAFVQLISRPVDVDSTSFESWMTSYLEISSFSRWFVCCWLARWSCIHIREVSNSERIFPVTDKARKKKGSSFHITDSALSEADKMLSASFRRSFLIFSQSTSSEQFHHPSKLANKNHQRSFPF